MQKVELKDKLTSFLCLTKPKQTFLLLLTSVFTYLGSGSLDPDVLLVLVAAMVLSISGTTAVNMALDADIDELMSRTKERPVPSGKVSRIEALLFGFFLFSLGVLLAYKINLLTAVATSLGVIFDLIVYTLWTKRRTPLSIVFGGVAGAAPSLAGWTAATGKVDLAAVLIMLITIAWIPSHIWYISIYFLEDYRRAGVPMLPVVIGVERTAKVIALSVLVMIASEVLLMVVGPFGPIYGLLAVPPTAALLYKAVKYSRNPTIEGARRMYKAASPIEGAVFLGIALDGLLRVLH